MHRHVFLRVVEALGTYDFRMRIDATGKMGLSPLQKCTVVIRILAYESPADNVDDYVRIDKSTIVECLERFASGVYVIFEVEYLRRPNNDDIESLLQMGETRGFPGSNNDINMLNQPSVFNDVLEGQAPTVQYTVNRTQYNMRYYLTYGIYPKWTIFVKTIPMPQGEKRKLFAQRQESVRKDVERTFGVLHSRFAIICGPARALHMDTLKYTMQTCIILHNMIVEDERHTYGGDFDYSYDHFHNDNSTTELFNGPHPDLTTLLHRIGCLCEKRTHRQLQADLTEHIWERFG